MNQMNSTDATIRVPGDKRAIAAVDLGAESCRVSLLRWINSVPVQTLVHRFPNSPRQVTGGLRWDLKHITEGLETGLKLCAQQAPEGIRSIAVDGWAVDYVRIDAAGNPLADPFCYRDERTGSAQLRVHERISEERLRAITGIQILPFNTVYQLAADSPELQNQPWLNLPEYFLARWSGVRVAELTNASHTELVEIKSRNWSSEIFAATGLVLDAAPRIVPPGTILGRLQGPLADLPAFRDTVLIAPACHDTASAVAGIPASGEDWAYISSGTWSLVGTLLNEPQNSAAVAKENFTNLAAAGGKICFHKNVNGMWLLRQCMETWSLAGHSWDLLDLIDRSERAAVPVGLLDVDEPDLLLPGNMPERFNQQRASRGYSPLDISASNAPEIVSLIFHSLAARYANVLRNIEEHSGKKLKKIFIVGGGSQNQFLNALTEAKTGLPVYRGAVESSTVGNFAIQLAALENSSNGQGVEAEHTATWAAGLQAQAV